MIRGGLGVEDDTAESLPPSILTPMTIRINETGYTQICSRICAGTRRRPETYSCLIAIKKSL
jgi:hypothetical protein